VRLGSTVETADGATAKLIGYSINRDGRLVGRYTDGVQRTLGQVRVARFNNPHGLEQRAGNLYRATYASGLPLETDADTDGAAAIASGGRERSNVDIGAEIIQLALARMQFRANLAVLDTTNAMHDELMAIGRLRRPR
jgi:flagellar hook protein FlgE